MTAWLVVFVGAVFFTVGMIVGDVVGYVSAGVGAFMLLFTICVNLLD